MQSVWWHAHQISAECMMALTIQTAGGERVRSGATTPVLNQASPKTCPVWVASLLKQYQIVSCDCDIIMKMSKLLHHNIKCTERDSLHPSVFIARLQFVITSTNTLTANITSTLHNRTSTLEYAWQKIYAKN